MKLFKKSVCAVLLFSFVFSYAASYSAVGLTDDGVLQSAPVLPPEDEIALMPQYDGRNYGIVTPVKDQGNSNLCWAYSTVAASETSILRMKTDESATKDNLSLNPVAAAYRVYKRESDPLGNTNGEWQSVDFMQAAGNPVKLARLFSMWWGPVYGNQAATVNPYENPSYRLENAFYIPENKEAPADGIMAVKKAIAKYGAVTFQYNNMTETEYYNPKNETGSGSSPHACTIIGWDDTIPASKFQPGGASQSGGWLVKNSYSSLEYFWLSYDNTSSSVYAFTYAPADKYDYNYYYDGSIDDFPLRNDKTIANVYQAKMGGTDGKSEYIKAVNVGISGENVTVRAEIYKNLEYPYNGQSNVPVAGGTLAAEVSGFYEHGGQVTLELDSTVRLDKDEWFSVIVSVSNPKDDAKIITSYKSGKDLSYSGGGDSWSKLGNFVGRIKVYTKLEDEVKTLDGNFTNLIVFARFDGEDEFINTQYNGVTVRQITDNSYNTADFCVSDYYSAVSDGKLRMNNVYLLDGGGSVKLSHSRGYYAEYSDSNPEGYTDSGERAARMYDLKLDWSSAVNSAIENGGVIASFDGTEIYGFDELDKNLDGIIDSITVIYKNTTQDISVGWASPLWNYKDYTDLVTIRTKSGALQSRYYLQLTNSYNYLYKDNGGSIILPIATAVHETGHIFGLKDLYNASGSSPVYFMSVMAKPISPVPQYITLKEREAMGWLDEDDVIRIASDGEYTIRQTGAYGSSFAVGCRLEIPEKGKTLYLEYRNFGVGGNKYDSQSKEIRKADGTILKGLALKSGLVCSLSESDIKFPSNMGCTAPKWNYEVLGGSYGTKSDAALGVGDEIYITDELRISVLSLNETELTFSISGIEHTHVPEDVWSYDSENHWRECAVCHTRLEIAPHTLSGWEITSEPSIVESGERKRTCSCGYTETETILLGDVNKSGTVGAEDAIILTRYLAGWKNVTVDGLMSDIDCDGRITLWDLIVLQRYLAGWYD